MSRKITITTPTNLSRADAEGRVQVQFTAANTSGAPERRLFRAVPLGDTKESWLALAGESERTFAADGVHQLSVSASVPPGTAAGRYGFRLDGISAQRAGEEVEEGPAVYFDYAGAVKDGPKVPWLWIAAALVLLIAGVGAWLVLRPTEVQANPPVVTTPTAQAEMVDVADVIAAPMDVADAIRKLQAAGLRTKLKFEENDDVRLGTVLDQSVPANSRAARGSAVELTVATSEEESMSLGEADEQDLSASGAKSLHDFFVAQRRVDVPDVLAGNAVMAIHNLQMAGLRVTLRGDRAAAALPGIVMSQQPDPRTEVRVGTPVTLFVSVNRDDDLTLSADDQAHISRASDTHLRQLFQSMQPPPPPPPDPGTVFQIDPRILRNLSVTTTHT